MRTNVRLRFAAPSYKKNGDEMRSPLLRPIALVLLLLLLLLAALGLFGFSACGSTDSSLDGDSLPATVWFDANKKMRLASKPLLALGGGPPRVGPLFSFWVSVPGVEPAVARFVLVPQPPSSEPRWTEARQYVATERKGSHLGRTYAAFDVVESPIDVNQLIDDWSGQGEPGWEAPR